MQFLALSVASLNLAMERDSGRILRDLATAPAVKNADILLFQEAVHSPAEMAVSPGRSRGHWVCMLYSLQKPPGYTIEASRS